MEGYEKMDCKCDICDREPCEIKRILLKNVGKVVTVFSETGGEAGKGFTGLVTKVEDGTVKLVTSIPSAPYENFRSRRRYYNDCDYNMCEHCVNSHFGSAIVIPICKIIAVSVVEI